MLLLVQLICKLVLPQHRYAQSTRLASCSLQQQAHELLTWTTLHWQPAQTCGCQLLANEHQAPLDQVPALPLPFQQVAPDAAAVPAADQRQHAALHVATGPAAPGAPGAPVAAAVAA